jgi:oxalate decarboxylase/phosphoglucose isomerase-like protein (cupin superfamily)
MKTTVTIAALLLTTCLTATAQTKPADSLGFKRIANAFDFIEENKKSNRSYGVFMRIPSMSSGVYTLHKGENDGQAPHTKDEIYYIIKGKAKIMVGKENYEVKEGSIVFVEAYKEHRFLT